MKKTLLTVGCTLAAAIALSAVGGAPVRAAEAAPSPSPESELEAVPFETNLSVEKGQDRTGAMRTSAIDGVNVMGDVTAVGGTNTTLTLSYGFGGYQGQTGDYLLVQMANGSSDRNTLFQIALWGGGQTGKVDGHYYTVPEPESQQQTDRSISGGDPSWGHFLLPASFSGWFKIPLTADAWTDAGNLALGAVDLRIPMDSPDQKNALLTVGEIGILRDGSYEAVVTKDVKVTSDSNNAGEVKVTGLVDGVTVEKMSAGEVKYDRTHCGKNGNDYLSYNLCVTLPTTDLTEYAGIRYYVDNSESGNNLYLQKWFAEANGANGTGGIAEAWYCNNENYYAMYYPEDGGTAEYGNALYVPAHFKGWVVLPFGIFFGSWGDHPDGVLNRSSVTGTFYFLLDGWRDYLPTENPAAFNPAHFLLKDFALVKAAEAPKTENIGDVHVFETFDYKSDEELRLYWDTRYRVAALAEVGSTDAPSATDGVGGKALSFRCGEVGPVASDSSFVTALEWIPRDEKAVDIREAKGFTFWIKNTSPRDLEFTIGFDLSVVSESGAISPQRWEPRTDARFLLLDTATGVQHTAVSKGAVHSTHGGGIVVPKGFEGWVRIGFDMFAVPAWSGVTAPFSSANKLRYVVFGMGSRQFEGHTFVLDSLGYYFNDVDVTTPFHKPANSFAAAMAGTAAQDAYTD